MFSWLFVWAAEAMNKFKVQEDGRTANEAITKHKFTHLVRSGIRTIGSLADVLGDDSFALTGQVSRSQHASSYAAAATGDLALESLQVSPERQAVTVAEQSLRCDQGQRNRRPLAGVEINQTHLQLQVVPMLTRSRSIVPSMPINICTEATH